MKRPSRDGDSVFTIRNIIFDAVSLFTKKGIDSPQITAETLLAHVMHLTKSRLYLSFDQKVTPEERASFNRLVARRLDREPLAYIVGEKGFWTLSLAVTPDVLIPRPDTECLVETALASIPEKKPTIDPYRILDLGTGSGAIIISLAKERPGHQFFAVDISMKALMVARENVHRNLLERSVHFFCGSWLDAITPDARFDVIVSNPPYIRKGDMASLEPEIRQYEPVLALDGDRDGLSALRAIIEASEAHLKPGGLLMIEIGDGQEKELLTIIQNTDCYARPTFHRDLTGAIRVVRVNKI